MAADEVGTARTIGSLIGKSTGGISGTLNKAAKKKGKANKAAKGSKPEVLTGTVIEPDPVSPVAKEPEIYDAEIVSHFHWKTCQTTSAILYCSNHGST